MEIWCKIDEAIYVALTDETYMQFAGLPYNETALKRISSMNMHNSEIFVKFFDEPRILYLSAIENIAEAKTKQLELKLHKLRREKIVSNSKYKYNNAPVNWNTWRQFNSIEYDPSVRKSVFDELIEKTHIISPIIERRFGIMKEVYSSMSENITPLSGYLENERLTFSELHDFVTQIGEAARKPFLNSMPLASEILGRTPDYYDDFYFFRNRIFKDVETPFIKVNPISEINRTLKPIGFDLSSISFDVEDRLGKYPSPICFFVRIPDDIRVLYKSESPYFDLQGCYHEVGHAIHATCIDNSLSYADKYKFPMGIAEIFSIFLERLTRNPLYLRRVFGITDDKLLDRLVKRNKFMELYCVTFYVANSLMKMKYWTENLSIDQACVLYQQLMEKFTGFRMPGEYWMLHHILPEAIMYTPSYLLAAVRAAELEKYLLDKFGEKWWQDKAAGSTLKVLMSKGATIDLSLFSDLNQDVFLKEIVDR
jgi:hypothetical protein